MCLQINTITVFDDFSRSLSVLRFRYPPASVSETANSEVEITNVLVGTADIHIMKSEIYI